MPTRTELEAAYRATGYRLFLPEGELELRIDQADPAFAAWLGRHGVRRWAILSACNPSSQPRPTAENLERQAALEVALLEAGFEPYAGENVADAGDWPVEETCLVPGMDAGQAVAFARRFGQNALVCGEADGLPRLVWIEQEQ